MLDEAALPSLRHLRVFAMVADLKSARKAADAVHLSQPAVTQAIAKVESQVGAVLFERHRSGTYLSAAGEIFAFRARLVFEQIEEALIAFGVSNGRGKNLDSIAQRITRPQIRGLTAIASCRSFAEAARKLDISPASLHRAARDLERTLGKPLFHNSVIGIVTTRAGAELARKLSLAMREIEWGIEEIKAAAGQLGGQLRVGAMPMAGSFLLATVLNQLADHFPAAHVQVRTGDGAALTKSLQLGEIDFVVGLNRIAFDPAEIEQEALLSSPYVLVARRGHPLADKAEISTKDLEAYGWIAPIHGAIRRAAFDRVCASMDNPPRANIEAYSLSTIRSLISESDRLTLLTRFEFDCEKCAGALTILPYRVVTPAHSIGVARRARWTPTALHLKFLDLMRARAAEIAGSEQYEEAA
jgi:DNA-binding transcriptional LysR family regulator